MIASRAGWTRKKPRAHYIGVGMTPHVKLNTPILAQLFRTMTFSF